MFPYLTLGIIFLVLTNCKKQPIWKAKVNYHYTMNLKQGFYFFSTKKFKKSFSYPQDLGLFIISIIKNLRNLLRIESNTVTSDAESVKNLLPHFLIFKLAIVAKQRFVVILSQSIVDRRYGDNGDFFMAVF